MNSIILDVGIKELLLEDARDFMKSRQWYADRGTTLILFSTLMLRHLNKFHRHPFPPRLPPVWGSWLWKDLDPSQSRRRAWT
jgi:hypothetical protein